MEKMTSGHLSPIALFYLLKYCFAFTEEFLVKYMISVGEKNLQILFCYLLSFGLMGFVVC